MPLSSDNFLRGFEARLRHAGHGRSRPGLLRSRPSHRRKGASWDGLEAGMSRAKVPRTTCTRGGTVPLPAAVAGPVAALPPVGSPATGMQAVPLPARHLVIAPEELAGPSSPRAALCRCARSQSRSQSRSQLRALAVLASVDPQPQALECDLPRQDSGTSRRKGQSED